MITVFLFMMHRNQIFFVHGHELRICMNDLKGCIYLIHCMELGAKSSLESKDYLYIIDTWLIEGTCDFELDLIVSVTFSDSELLIFIWMRVGFAT